MGKCCGGGSQTRATRLAPPMSDGPIGSVVGCCASGAVSLLGDQAPKRVILGDLAPETNPELRGSLQQKDEALMKLFPVGETLDQIVSHGLRRAYFRIRAMNGKPVPESRDEPMAADWRGYCNIASHEIAADLVDSGVDGDARVIGVNIGNSNHYFVLRGDGSILDATWTQFGLDGPDVMQGNARQLADQLADLPPSDARDELITAYDIGLSRA